jgi:hypothetical protein
MCCDHLNRRSFFGLTTRIMVGAGLFHPSMLYSAEKMEWDSDGWNPEEPFRATGKMLRVQPVLMYRVAERREASSWKSWGGIQTDQAASEEMDRISKELNSLSTNARFPLEILPAIKIKTESEATEVGKSDYDVLLLYPATGSGRLFQACVSNRGDQIIFVRHRSGPIYYWYEALSVQYLSTNDEELPQRAVSVHDVVVDDYHDLLWRLRALYGVKNFIGSRIVALGGAGGKYSPEAPKIAWEKYKIKIIEVGYDAIGPRIQRTLTDGGSVSRAEKWTDRYLSIANTALMTDKKFVVNAFLLYAIIKNVMRDNDARAFTIKDCMQTIMPMAHTTACLALSLLNDEGLLAFCESDFVIIPSGILLHHISGKPVFLHNSTFPHDGVVTCAHCTAPRRMDGARYEPAKIMTHYESEYGAAPKVEMPEGQEVTFIDPEYSTGRWVGFKGRVKSNPFYEICRSQQDVEIQGDWRKLVREVRDSHWVMAYGDYLKEVEYAARKIGVRWENISRIL